MESNRQWLKRVASDVAFDSNVCIRPTTRRSACGELGLPRPILRLDIW